MVDHVSQVGMGGAGHARKLNKSYNLPEAKRGDDAVNISSDVMRLKGIEGIRLEKVMEVRRAIQNGTYLTDEKLSKALDSAIDEAIGGK